LAMHRALFECIVPGRNKYNAGTFNVGVRGSKRSFYDAQHANLLLAINIIATFIN
jgi:hypothetical protein